MDGGDSAAFSGFFYTRTESSSWSFIYTRPTATNANRWAASRQPVLARAGQNVSCQACAAASSGRSPRRSTRCRKVRPVGSRRGRGARRSAGGGAAQHALPPDALGSALTTSFRRERLCESQLGFIVTGAGEPWAVRPVKWLAETVLLARGPILSLSH